MIREKVYLVGIHRYLFRAGEPAEILGVEEITPENGTPRLCYHVLWSDKVEDSLRLDEIHLYKFIAFNDIVDNKIPEVTE